ncbi:chemotaxis response regulator protein-glutamate methylesterase [Aliiglaciecola sp. CAU 1673]|uniref:protein-glutamate methylesterase/protein-glutamine glutaminase n=1 Tax=Aliiglaciecola sp. CAU 1673 TaxID=3032595 RepID=UPI0023DAC6D7|nr:chemotaxis response regulator protein-glutamate methylesterase [Aliiglaciecola sp. CAU 1673]MDF2177099.1 chemotaxis response regulator protein-glutamate methylesterase [Aliiglaciecola sp. CAU 1673]
MTIKVLVVDDSALIRQLLGEIIRQAPGMELVGTAQDAYVAREMVNAHAPDVITLDIEMPKVDGLTFLDRLMKARPTPVLMISTLTEAGAEATLRALELGAVDYIAKPKIGVAQGIEEYRNLILDKIRTCARAKVKRVDKPVSAPPPSNLSLSTEKLIAIGASTGGTEAIKEVLIRLPANSPAVLITQHMPPGFTTTYAKRLDGLCAMRVAEAKDGERVLPGHAYLAPGSLHMVIEKSGADYRIKLLDTERVSGHKPSVDVMFQSLAKVAGRNLVAMLLTGMGKDGAEGLAEIHRQGAFTLAQDEQSCVVFGMPKEAIRLGAAAEVLPIDRIAPRVIEQLRKLGAGSRL